MHWAWNAETTFWLRALDAACVRMPDYHGGEDRPNPSGKPQRTFPPYRPPDDGRGIIVLRKYEPGEDPSDIVVVLEEALREETLPVQERRREKKFRLVAFQTRPTVMATRVFGMLTPTHFHHGDSPYWRFCWSGSSRRGC